ncbi:protein TRACHEARY ELEMENT DIFFERENTIATION-RELATED 7A-like [Impatiens glandulifera]|uniref:protein TRACHEARY ELEMENT DIFFERENTIATION-RELATED 7A-like n=1 Tax=Impatiens glandulifera TaxID=253017 RepID=UPI001FB0951F|nr:protein TRACHEARY ELEMENT DIFFERENTIATION-RELATED 7A-like [Impatiens glandulifera]
MAFVPNYGFPYSSSPPPPHFPILPPPYHPNFPPPPPPAAAKPPSHPTLPPPPHPRSPPPPPPAIPPPPSPGHHTTIIVVFVSLGGLFLLGFLSVALCCFLKKRKKKQIQEMEVVRVDEHLKIREAVVPGPNGTTQTVILSIDEDIHVEEETKKNEIVSQVSQNHPGHDLEIAKATTSSDAKNNDIHQKS